MELKNKTYLVTGGASGIGAATARTLAQAGGNVVIADVNVDSWPDIVTLNGAPWEYGQTAGNIVRIYWGGPEGYLLTKRYDLGVPDDLPTLAETLRAAGYLVDMTFRIGGIPTP